MSLMQAECYASSSSLTILIQLDTHHNEIHTVHFNIFINFATTAMKIPHYFGMSHRLSPHEAKLVFGASYNYPSQDQY